MDFYTAAIFTFVAGISTGLGGLALFFKEKNEKVMSVSFGFAAGVMIYLSLTAILEEAKEHLIMEAGEKTGGILTVICFFLGIAIIALLDATVCRISERSTAKTSSAHSESNNWHCSSMLHGHNDSSSLMKTGLFTAIAISLHNIPEGVAMFLTALNDASIALPLFTAVILHNIPVGMAIAVPVYFATNSKLKSCMYALATGLVQPIAAILGYFAVLPFLNDFVFGILFAISAGLMIFIALDDLLPSAFKYGKHHHTTFGIFAGMAVMAITIVH